MNTKTPDLNSRKRGFSIIELSVAISVAATVAVGYLVWAKPSNLNNAEKITVTRERMIKIEKALSDFYAVESRLPCPADPLVRADGTRASGSGTYGFAREAIGVSLTGISCDIELGMPPVVRLGLEEEYGYDGWGRQFLYHISDALCGSDSAASDPTEADSCTAKEYASATADLTVKNEAGTDISTEVAYVLTSHGPDGISAYLPSGQTVAGTANENGDADTVYQLTASNASNSDLVNFKTKSQIGSTSLDTIATVISAEACNQNADSLETISNSSTNALDNNSDGITQFQVSSTSASKNSGSELVLGMLWGVQALCIEYFGNTADSNVGWDGPTCPGGGTFDTTSNICVCAKGTWDGDCSI